MSTPLMVDQRQQSEQFLFLLSTHSAKRVQWQDLNDFRSQSHPEVLHQTPESFVSLPGSPESSIPVEGLSNSHLTMSADIQSMNNSLANMVDMNSMTSVLLAQQLPPLAKFSGSWVMGALVWICSQIG